jgi:hypothetical protein
VKLSEQERAHWQQTWLVASIWYCGDEDFCDCSQPVIELVYPNRQVGPPWVHRERVWEGTFHSQATGDEYREQRRELYRECRKRGIRLCDNRGELLVPEPGFV